MMVETRWEMVMKSRLNWA